jgi:hypothetical protein
VRFSRIVKQQLAFALRLVAAKWRPENNARKAR